MLFAASESAVTKKPRLRLTIRRSSSLSAAGSFHCAISRCIETSCGIQWLAQPARYLSHAQWYLNGTSWLTSVAPLIARLSAARTRWVVLASGAAGVGAAAEAAGLAPVIGSSKSSIFVPCDYRWTPVSRELQRPRETGFGLERYWQASQSGSSSAQNFGSPAWAVATAET